jgi:endonuclease/exonuclease/phosphatase family metal-dependent hydrolase
MLARIAAVVLFLIATTARAADPGVSVMTFNIRYGTANDGENRWERRLDMVLGVIAERDADVVGLQEALAFQIDAITAAHPGYGVIGVGRDDGRTGGEHAAILYRTERFAVDASGTFWLSDTPEVVASKSWGNGITRVCTWARLIDRDTGRGVYVFNAHLDHQSQPSRERSTRLIGDRVAARAHGDPVVFMGDFNAGEDNPAVAWLGGAGWTNAFRAAQPEATEVGTFNAFRGETVGAMIDHVFVRDGLRVLDADIDRTNDAGRYPSDHFPVWASLAWEKEEGRP